MNATNGHGEPDASAAVSTARPVVLIRYRPGVTGETARIVHVVPLLTDGQAGTVSALCGALLSLANIETVTPGQGMPCQLCVVNHVTSSAVTGEPPAANPDSADTARLAAGGVTFQEWGWPVTCHRDQVRLNLHHDVSALTIPIPLCTTVIEILTQRRCAPPVLAHPYTPERRIVLTGERYGVMLPWPPQVHQVTGFLLLPPHRDPARADHLGTATARGLPTAVSRDRSLWGGAHRPERPTRRPTARQKERTSFRLRRR
ncbi:MAG: hypothetical protein ACRDTA_24695 [Pseudonocardiaceae bacterium]